MGLMWTPRERTVASRRAGGGDPISWRAIAELVEAHGQDGVQQSPTVTATITKIHARRVRSRCVAGRVLRNPHPWWNGGEDGTNLPVPEHGQVRYATSSGSPAHTSAMSSGLGSIACASRKRSATCAALRKSAPPGGSNPVISRTHSG